MNPITLPVYYIPEDIAALNDLGINPERPLSEYEVREATFYSIAAVTPYHEEDKIPACIHSNGTQFISPLSYEKVIELIQANNSIVYTQSTFPSNL